MSGKYGTATPTANTLNTVCTFTKVCTVNIRATNYGATTALIRIAVATNDTPTTAEWIEYDYPLPPFSGLDNTGIACSVGEKIVVYDNKGTVSYRVHGFDATI